MADFALLATRAAIARNRIAELLDGHMTVTRPAAHDIALKETLFLEDIVRALESLAADSTSTDSETEPEAPKAANNKKK